MTSTVDTPDPATDPQTPAGLCKRPGCGTPLPARHRGRTRQFCSTDCARRYHNDARTPTTPPPATDPPADPHAAHDGLIRQAVVLVKAAHTQTAALDPARVRAALADADAARRRAEAHAADATAQAHALADALDTAREDLRAAHADVATARDQATTQIAAARSETAAATRDRDDAVAAAERAAAETTRARADTDQARADTERVRVDAARERDTLREHYQAQLDALTALTTAERARAQRAEHLLETLTTATVRPDTQPDQQGGAGTDRQGQGPG